MNKYKKAYDFIASNMLEWDYYDDCDMPKEYYEEEKKSLEVIKKLVEKATPKKPIMLPMKGFEEEVASHMCCPNCEQQIVNVWSKAEYQPNYCHYCGQAILWESNE